MTDEQIFQDSGNRVAKRSSYLRVLSKFSQKLGALGLGIFY